MASGLESYVNRILHKHGFRCGIYQYIYGVDVTVTDHLYENEWFCYRNSTQVR